jgi:hypothetical protein
MPRRPVIPSLESLELPAPVGGLNALSAATALPPQDALVLYNLTAAELGQRVRSGWSEWTVGLTGATDNRVRTVIPFSGSHKNGSTDKLFVTTSSGIWDASTKGALTTAWAPLTVYSVGSITQAGSFVANGGNTYVCIIPGTSAGSGGPTGTGSDITDGTCHWAYVSANTAPTLLVSFGTTSGEAGYGTHTVFSTTGGRFLIYCDEENGMYIYSETGGTWTKTASDTTVLWSPATVHLVGDKVVNDSPAKVYTCTTAGTSAGSGGPTGTGGAIADNTVVWAYQHAQAASAIGPSQADHRLGYAADPANFAAVCVWGSKVWLVEKDTSRAWWLATSSIYGTATSQDFGTKMRAGGPLVNLYNWSYDAGVGMDTLLVGVSTAGDIVIYRGTDPASPSTFALKGSWTVGGVPYGRRIGTEYGGELLIMSLRGVVEMSKLVVGAPASEGNGSLYDSDRIAPLFNLDAQLYYSNLGWQVGECPQDNALLYLVPASGNGVAAKPYVMSQSNRSWSLYRDWPILSMAVWNGVMYFGTPDGRVAKVGGYVDGVLYQNSSSFSPIDWSWVSGFSDGGTTTQKRVETIQPLLECQETAPPLSAEARYDLDMTEAAAPSVSSPSSATTWDSATWDSSVWGGAYAEYAPIIGGVGMGRTVAVAVRGRAASRTAIVGVGITYRTGGLL